MPAVEQASRILFFLAASGSARPSLTEICREVGIHKSKGYSILNTLMDSTLVVRDPGAKTYSLGPGLLALSRAVLDHSDLRSAAAPYLEALARETQSSALLGLIRSDRVFVVAKREAATDVGITIRIGHNYPLTWGSHGKAIVSSLPEGRREEILASGRFYFHGQGRTGETTDLEGIRSEIQEARRLGYGKDLGQVQPGIHAVSAPIFGSGASPIGCVIVVGTFPRASAEIFGERAASAAREISRLLGPTLERVYPG